ncbi:uncharacterized protein LOC5565239 [Aedes aegypti]|uniref:Selenoprotein P N-terminal domain-containing protein n=1 Tax=Aedes aegypti TaxID=7159 RepID=A0A1S4G373_AEDAE|nr:uncharacterized protein LOC5565239 [Aedes aegypti]
MAPRFPWQRRRRPLLLAVLLVLLGGSPGICLGMSVDQDATCSHLDRRQYSTDQNPSEPMIEEEFRGQVTVLYSVAPPKPFLTRRIFMDRDPVYYNKINYDEQIQLFHNLFNRFEHNGYRNVQFILGAAPSRHPDETEFTEFEDFLDNVTSVAAGYNISVYPNPLNENGTFAMFGLKEFQVYVVDRCSRISYIIEPPWSLIQYSYVKAAVLSTMYDRPCGECDVDNFLNASLPEKKLDQFIMLPALNVTETASGSSKAPAILNITEMVSGTKGTTTLAPTTPMASDVSPYDESTESEEVSVEEYSEVVSTTDEPTVVQQSSNITEVNATDSEEDYPFANFNPSGPELVLPLKIIIPAIHIHYDQPKENNSYEKYSYVVFQSDNPSVHQHGVGNDSPVEQSSLREVSLTNETTANSTLRVIGVDWPLAQLYEILNTTTVFYDERTTQVYQKLARYNASGFDELEEISVSSQYAAWKRRQADLAEQAKTEKRHFIRKHYERLIQWLSWQFDKS